MNDTVQQFFSVKVGWQEAIDGVAWLSEIVRGVLTNVFYAQWKEGNKESIRSIRGREALEAAETLDGR